VQVGESTPEGSVQAEQRRIQVTPSRFVSVTPVFDGYWKFAHHRQEIFFKRVLGQLPPWTDDEILREHRFTNVYRAADRVSQYLIRHVLYEGPQDAEEIFFRALLFKFFNRIETWEALQHSVGPPELRSFDPVLYGRVLDGLLASGQRIYSAAYIMPSPAFGNARKHENHLALLEHMMRSGAPRRVSRAKSLEEVFGILRGYRSLGDFLAFQFTIDLNYSEMTDFQESEFVVAGPGARNGIRKCFADTAGLSEADIIRLVAELAEREFARQGLMFKTLWGRPLQLIDCQNVFCEVDKYARVAYPSAKGLTNRTRIKQRYFPKGATLQQWYPPKWKLSPPANATVRNHERHIPVQLALP
jgi:hypothetical protein